MSDAQRPTAGTPFASRGIRDQERAVEGTEREVTVQLAAKPLPPVLDRLNLDPGKQLRLGSPVASLLSKHAAAARTPVAPPKEGISAGKNTYTYDAHTYHTKVPPQGIAAVLDHYLPDGGLVLDAFAGSGMTGVAAAATDHDCILNELSPAACFISSQFSARPDPDVFEAAVRAVLEENAKLRSDLYSTTCRECGESVEAEYFVWSYKVTCPHCATKFVLWDEVRSYGEKVRDHKILTEFPCPNCTKTLKKSTLERHDPVPVQVGYRHCGSKQQEVTHAPNKDDLAKIERLKDHSLWAKDFVPHVDLPDGINLRQPKKHGMTTVASFYSDRNMAAMSNLWHTIHRIEDPAVAGALAFVFTSLYQRVTQLSEFRFWGGSGNSPRFNVPYIYNEANVFKGFARKAKTIHDHLASTVQYYRGDVAVAEGSATDMSWLPDGSVDFIFTDPPFGASINYSEMNILWEAWLGEFTDTEDEAIINKVQGKGVDEYQNLMTESLAECHRVLRDGSWMVVVFMDSSTEVWRALRKAITEAGFEIKRVDIFDKQQATFKHAVSENTAGCDLMLHCRKRTAPEVHTVASKGDAEKAARDFLDGLDLSLYQKTYRHVRRDAELDTRRLYSEWLARQVVEGAPTIDYPAFRAIAQEAQERQLVATDPLAA